MTYTNPTRSVGEVDEGRIKMNRLYRSREDKILFGLLGGLAGFLSVDPSLLRLGFLVVTFFTGCLPLTLIDLVGRLIVPLAPVQEREGN